MRYFFYLSACNAQAGHGLPWLRTQRFRDWKLLHLIYIGASIISTKIGTMSNGVSIQC